MGTAAVARVCDLQEDESKDMVVFIMLIIQIYKSESKRIIISGFIIPNFDIIVDEQSLKKNSEKCCYFTSDLQNIRI